MAATLQEGALTALASVADCAKAAFVRYYDSVMPLLRTALTSKAEDKQQVPLSAADASELSTPLCIKCRHCCCSALYMIDADASEPGW